jgi:hypothetical protein
MKTTSTPEPESSAVDELRAEYRFDYRKARPNRFAGQIDKSQVVVMLDPDISEVFTTPESVSAILRALIATMPPARPDSGRTSSSELATESAGR